MYKTIKLLAVAVPLLLSNIVYGAGFALYEFSARGTAMGGATMANKAEPASLAVNPALITELEGTQLQLGGTIVTAEATATVSGATRSLKDDVWLLPNFFITHKISDDVSVGLGGYSRFGLGGEYQNNRTWVGSGLAYQVNLQTFSFTPTLAVKMSEEVSISMGLEAMVVSFSESALGTLGANGPLLPSMGYKISGSGVSWGGKFGLLYKPLWAEQWGFGATYQSKVKQTVNGRVESNFVLGPGLGIMPGDARGSIAMPDSISAGVSYQPTEKLILEAGVIATFWSAYDQIMVEYKEGNTVPITDKKNYKDTYRLNIGAEYMLTDAWAVRGGFVYDQSPTNPNYMDTLVPVDNRHIASIGAGYKQKDWTLDVMYARIFGSDLSGYTNPSHGSKTISYSDSGSNMYGVTFGYKF